MSEQLPQYLFSSLSKWYEGKVRQHYTAEAHEGLKQLLAQNDSRLLSLLGLDHLDPAAQHGAVLDYLVHDFNDTLDDDREQMRHRDANLPAIPVLLRMTAFLEKVAATIDDKFPIEVADIDAAFVSAFGNHTGFTESLYCGVDTARSVVKAMLEDGAISQDDYDLEMEILRIDPIVGAYMNEKLFGNLR